MAAIAIEDVTKQFGDVTALQNLDLTVEDGEVFGFLGPNGAGKSTTIDILLDHTRPTTGTARVFGKDAQSKTVAIREQTGVLPDGFGMLGRMTGRKHVEFALEAKDATGATEPILERVGIDHAADRMATDYSKGMQQRLMLGMALAGKPDLLILDEPTTGLDPNGARTMREIVEAEADRGATVFFSSHILEQVEAVCDRVGILNHGQLAAVDTIDGLRAAAGASGQISITLSSVPPDLTDTIAALDGVSGVTAQDTTLRVACENDVKGAVVHHCFQAASVENIETSDASLEDIFLSYTEGGV